mmetsp:Transcript_41667/g.120332  ORF Transcript_41667/g.120332 Transcript_41667/m.120332 type:complete len:239 (+) Transcript_41667:615-1331(+)
MDELQMQLEHGWRKVEAQPGQLDHVLKGLWRLLVAPVLLSKAGMAPVLIQHRLPSELHQVINQLEAFHRVAEEIPQVRAKHVCRDDTHVRDPDAERIIECEHVRGLSPGGNHVGELALGDAIDEAHEEVVVETFLDTRQRRGAIVASFHRVCVRLAATPAHSHAVSQLLQQVGLVGMLLPELVDAAVCGLRLHNIQDAWDLEDLSTRLRIVRHRALDYTVFEHPPDPFVVLHLAANDY